MKFIFRILPLVITVALFSCKKEEVSPSTPGSSSPVHVEYRVSAVSGNVTIYQDVPMSGQNTLHQEKVTCNRPTYSYTFDVSTGKVLKLSASNTNPGPEEVIAEIYVNNRLVGSASANAPGADAVVTVSSY